MSLSTAIKKKGQPGALKAPAYARSRKGSHHYWCIVRSLTLFSTAIKKKKNMVLFFFIIFNFSWFSASSDCFISSVYFSWRVTYFFGLCCSSVYVKETIVVWYGEKDNRKVRMMEENWKVAEWSVSCNIITQSSLPLPMTRKRCWWWTWSWSRPCYGDEENWAMMLCEGPHSTTFLALFHHPYVFCYLFHHSKPQ